MRENTKLVKIIGDKAVFVKGNMIIVLDIDKKALQVLQYYLRLPVNNL